MQYKSTRNSALRLEASQVIAQGISQEGGLFVPVSLPDVSDKLREWSHLGYQELAQEIFALFLTDFSTEEIARCVKQAYAREKFAGSEPVKVVSFTENKSVQLLELWHR